jgi:hypothetical protein
VEILRLDVESEHVGDQDVQGTRNLIDGVRREVRPGVRGTPQVARGRPLPARSGPGGIHGLRWLNFLTIRRPNGAGAGLKMTAAQRFRKSQLTARLAARISPMSVGLRESLFRVEQACLRHLGLHFGSPRVPVGIDDCPAFSLIRQCHGIRHFNCSQLSVQLSQRPRLTPSCPCTDIRCRQGSVRSLPRRRNEWLSTIPE